MSRQHIILNLGLYYRVSSFYLFILVFKRNLSRTHPSNFLSLHVLYCYFLAQMVKNLPAMQETQVQPLGWEDSLEKGMATHSSVLAWRIPWTEEPSGR